MATSRQTPPLTSRAVDILHSIVQTYIQTGRPVASRSISKMRKHQLSPASIRNVMADLAEAGYLEQPHTSAGRVPTAKAFQLFVQTLSARRLIEEEIERLKRELIEADTVSERIARSSHMLTEMTRSFGIAAAIPAESQRLEQVELVALGGGRVLMILITADKLVHNRVITLDQPVTAEELVSIRNYINRHFGGWTLSGIRRELRTRLEAASSAYDSILRKLILLYDKGLLDFEADPEIHTEGTWNLVAADFHLTREKLRELFRELEEKKRVLELLERFLEGPPGQVNVQVGLGEAHPTMKELSLIGVSVPLPGGLDAKIAVVGPMRMNYQRVMSAVLHMGRAMQALPV